jgi:hypothetical protein
MAKYTVLETSFIDNHLRNAGEIIEYVLPADTTLGTNLALVKAPKRASSTDPVEAAGAEGDAALA